VPKSDLGLRPENPTHRNARPERLRRGPPQGRKTLWGKEGAPQRGGLPVV